MLYQMYDQHNANSDLVGLGGRLPFGLHPQAPSAHRHCDSPWLSLVGEHAEDAGAALPTASHAIGGRADEDDLQHGGQFVAGQSIRLV